MKARSHWKRATRVCRCCVCGHVSINQTVCWRRAGWYQMLACENAEFVLLPLRQSWTKRQGRSSLRNTSVANRTSRRPAVPSGPSRAAGSSSTSLEASWKPVSQLRYDQWELLLEPVRILCSRGENSRNVCCSLFSPWSPVSLCLPGFQRQPAAVARHQLPRGGGYQLDSLDFRDDARGWRLDMDMVIIYIYSVNWVVGFFVFCFLCYLFFPSFWPTCSEGEKKLIQLHKTATCSWNSFLGCLFSECLSVQV